MCPTLLMKIIKERIFSCSQNNSLTAADSHRRLILICLVLIAMGLMYEKIKHSCLWGTVKSMLNVAKPVIKEVKLEKSETADILHRKHFRILSFQYLKLSRQDDRKNLYIYITFCLANAFERKPWHNDHLQYNKDSWILKRVLHLSKNLS